MADLTANQKALAIEVKQDSLGREYVTRRGDPVPRFLTLDAHFECVLIEVGLSDDGITWIFHRKYLLDN